MSINPANKELGEGCVFCNNNGVNSPTVWQAKNAKFQLKFSGDPQRFW